MKFKSILLILISVLIFANPLFASWYFKSAANMETNFYLSGFYGTNKMGQGYENYKNYSLSGADLYILREKLFMDLDKPNWKEKISYRVSFEYQPLVVPEGNYNTTEDIYVIAGDLLYSLWRPKGFWLFFGLGGGLYADKIKINTPATGNKSYTYYNPGFRPFLGCGLNLGKNVQLVPEMRMHYIWTVSTYFSKSTSYQLGFKFKI